MDNSGSLEDDDIILHDYDLLSPGRSEIDRQCKELFQIEI